MKITLEFDGFEERAEALAAMKVSDYQCAMHEFEHWLRGHWKHGDSDTISVDAVWGHWHECKADYGLSD
jgi:hypothetical protein